MNVLFVVAHPDDEVLGGGGTIWRMTQSGHNVTVCILCGGAEARSFRPETDEIVMDINEADKLLGVSRVILGHFKDSELNTVPHLEVVRFIEDAMMTSGAEEIITHHPSDLHNDHQITSICCQEAARLSMRQTQDVPLLCSLSYMEVPSSTDWALNPTLREFAPNSFVGIGKEGVEMKLKALETYRGVMRRFPHPRCEQIINGLAAYRGGQAGCEYAEAFECVFRRGL